jgi:hypothetical protein
VTGTVIEAGDQSEAAGILFVRRTAQAPILPARIGAVEAGIERACIVNCHTPRAPEPKPCEKNAGGFQNKNLNSVRGAQFEAPVGANAAKRACVCNS